MQSIPEIATQIVNNSITNVGKDNSRTIFLVGSKTVVSEVTLVATELTFLVNVLAKVPKYIKHLFFSGQIYIAIFILR